MQEAMAAERQSESERNVTSLWSSRAAVSAKRRPMSDGDPPWRHWSCLL